MTKYISIILLLIISLTIQAQGNIDFSAVKLETEADYRNAEPAVINASNYILSTPFDGEDMQRTQAIQLILVWMEGTSDYGFDFDFIDKLDNEIPQTTTFLASLAKYALENKDLYAEGNKTVIYNSIFETFLLYCENPKNNIKQGRKLKRLIKAHKKGQLQQELNK